MIEVNIGSFSTKLLSEKGIISNLKIRNFIFTLKVKKFELIAGLINYNFLRKACGQAFFMKSLKNDGKLHYNSKLLFEADLGWGT